VPLLVKVLLLAARSKRGRELIFMGLLGAIEAARSEQARKALREGRRLATGPQARSVGRAAVRAGTRARKAAVGVVNRMR
jgi:hypothetical protein